MAYMTWNDRLSVGVKALDDQHIVLVETVNELHAAMLKGKARTVAGEILQRLVNYTVEHFATEERLMTNTRYPDQSKHHEQHEALTKQVLDYQQRLERGDITLSVHLLNFLSDWLVKHIQGEDQKYGPWMNSHGIN